MAPGFNSLEAALADRYQIEREIGQGGMANVYLAKDLKHERQVAIKVLKPALATAIGAERFLAEIKTTANLQHPHILPLHDSGEADSFLYFVMPYVEGESLRQRLDREGALPVAEALRLVMEVADGLSHAHARDVLHRDIKPANILLSSGHALIADFGIAKAIADAGGSTLTQTGVLIGTPTYMSPEQFDPASELDDKSDQYALAVVLFEVLGGAPPYQGPTVAAILGGHLGETAPSLRERRPDTPEPVASAVERALSTDPSQRFDDLAEFVKALQVPGGAQEGARPKSRTRIAFAAVSSIIALVASVMLSSRGEPPSSPPTPVRRQVTFVGDVLLSSLSPDGSFLAYIAGERGNTRLMLQDLVGGEPHQLDSADRMLHLEWAPDGASILYHRALGEGNNRTAFIIPRLGGEPQPIPAWTLSHWSADGSQVASWLLNFKEIWITDVATGEWRPEALTGSFEWLYEADWWNERGVMALVTSEGERYTLSSFSPDEGRRRELFQDNVVLSSPRWAPAGGAVYFLRFPGTTADLMKVEMSPDGTARGPPVQVLTGLEASSTPWDHALSLSRDGRRLAVTNSRSFANLWLVNVDDEMSEQELTRGTTAKELVGVSPDGGWASYLQRGPSGQDLFAVSIDEGRTRQLTRTGNVSGGGWSPEGDEIAFINPGPGGTPMVWRTAVGSGTAAPVEGTFADLSGHLAWGPGERIVYSTPGNGNFLRLDPETSTQDTLLRPRIGFVSRPMYSPDGGSVVFHSNGAGGEAIWLVGKDGASPRRIVDQRAFPFGWSADQTVLYVGLPGSRTIEAVQVLSGARIPAAELPFPADCRVVPGPDLRFVCLREETLSDVWVIERFDPEAEPAGESGDG